MRKGMKMDQRSLAQFVGPLDDTVHEGSSTMGFGTNEEARLCVIEFGVYMEWVDLPIAVCNDFERTVTEAVRDEFGEVDYNVTDLRFITVTVSENKDHVRWTFDSPCKNLHASPSLFMALVQETKRCVQEISP